MKSPLLVAALLGSFCPALVAQSVGAESGQSKATRSKAAPAKTAPSFASVQHLRKVLSFLASDALAGRDSPSPGLDKAGEFLAAQAEKAGLEPGGDGGTFFQSYRLPGIALDDAAVSLAVPGDSGELHALRPHEDFRLWRAGVAEAGEPVDVFRVDAAQAAAQRYRLRGKPVLLEVDPASALWRAAAEPVRPRLAGRRRRRSPPWLLVRSGVLPGGGLRAVVGVPEAQRREVVLRNVVALLPGSDRAREVVLVSAHYDHIGVGLPKDGDEIYNGADDDGTGSTAVLAIAQALAARQPKLSRTVAFVWFSAEERGLLGSKAFAERPPFRLADVVANVNIEMLGRPWKPRTAWITGRELSDFEARARPAFERGGVEVETFPQQAMLFGASDNWPFAAKGVVAHSVSASSLHSDYHQPSDEVDRIDFENMAVLVRGLTEVVADFANADGRPAYNEGGRRRLHLDEDK